MRTHKSDLDVKVKAIQFSSQEQASAFMSAFEQGGADHIKLNGNINGQPFHASFQDKNGHVKEQFALASPKPQGPVAPHQPKAEAVTTVVQPKHETVITTASGHTFTAGITTGSMSSVSSGGDHGAKGGSGHDAGASNGGAGNGGGAKVKPVK